MKETSPIKRHGVPDRGIFSAVVWQVEQHPAAIQVHAYSTISIKNYKLLLQSSRGESVPTCSWLAFALTKDSSSVSRASLKSSGGTKLSTKLSR
jgi:hypothetical protein